METELYAAKNTLVTLAYEILASAACGPRRQPNTRQPGLRLPAIEPAGGHPPT